MAPGYTRAGETWFVVAARTRIIEEETVVIGR